MSRTLTERDRQWARDVVRQHRSEDGWLGTLPQAFPERIGNTSTTLDGVYRAVPPNVKAFSDNYLQNSVNTSALKTDGLGTERAVNEPALRDEVLGQDARIYGTAARPSWMNAGGTIRVLRPEVQLVRDNAPANLVDSTILSGRAGGADPALEPHRAVDTPHQKTNSTNERVLAGTANAVTEDASVDAGRAAGPGHLKNRAAIKRVIGDEALSEGRQYRLRNRPAWMAGTGQVRGIPGDSDPNPVKVLRDNLPVNVVSGVELSSAAAEENNASRSVTPDHVRQNAIKSLHGSAGDTIHSKVDVDAIGRRELMSHATDDGRRGVGPDHIRDETMDRRHFRVRSMAGFNGLKSLPENVKVDGEELVGRINTNAYLQEDNFKKNGVAQTVVPPGSLQAGIPGDKLQSLSVPPGALMSGISVSKISFLTDAGRYLEEVPPQAIKPGLDGSKLDKGSVPPDRIHGRVPKTKLPGTVVYSDNYDDLGEFLRSQAFTDRVRAIIFPHSHPVPPHSHV